MNTKVDAITFEANRGESLICTTLGIKAIIARIRSMRHIKLMTKGVDYSHPTSPNADKFGFSRQGCWTVSMHRMGKIPRAVSAHATEAEARAVAEAMPEIPWNWMYIKREVS